MRSPSLALPFALALAAGCQVDTSEADTGPDFGGETVDTTGDSDVGDSDVGESGESDSDSGDTDPGSEDSDSGDTGTGVTCESTPSPWDPWIGGPCETNADCAYADGFCMYADEGWPCGTCTQPCDLVCPDVEGAPETFCVAESWADPFAPGEGACLSKCDPQKFPGDGCREAYTCVLAERFSQADTKAAVCVPEEGSQAQPKTACQQALDDAGLSWVPAQIALDHPDDHPDLDCVIEDPVRLFSPVNGVDYRYVSLDAPTSLLVSCDMALALNELSALAREMDTVEIAHIGTYNCRVISGTQTLSQHSFAQAIDLAGFTLEGGDYLTVLDDWEDNVPEPATFAGQWLKTLADAMWDQSIFNIILTPNYNAAHDNHFHVDLEPGASYYE